MESLAFSVSLDMKRCAWEKRDHYNFIKEPKISQYNPAWRFHQIPLYQVKNEDKHLYKGKSLSPFLKVILTNTTNSSLLIEQIGIELVAYWSDLKGYPQEGSYFLDIAEIFTFDTLKFVEENPLFSNFSQPMVLKSEAATLILVYLENLHLYSSSYGINQTVFRIIVRNNQHPDNLQITSPNIYLGLY